ncbi:hypothetical protein CVT24_007316 [Panaeolus cyanescens]|uniref:Uncharacterized protein n=1 Tax=Panaeolus cyanescens TaxID=181874 RepID=A0A409X8X5_9AGAR|nr:hypothetical protein CVT24_007316 [Panaeolus cyanescens]
MTDLPDEPDVLNQILAQYIRAVLEFSVTVLRTVYTQDNNQLFPGGVSVIPPNMRATTNGTYFASTIGWNVDPDAAVGILLAPTLVSLAAIGVIVWTLISRHREGHGRQEHECNYHFDPTDILHIISAASAGGLNTPFPPFHEDTVAHAKGVVVTLKPVQGGRPGFINYDKKVAV